jgi:valyl-tRNA synthetase
VKTRAYGDPADAGAASARAALALALSVQLRLFAPFLPFVTEEVWSWWRPGSVHRQEWPDAITELSPALGEDDGEWGAAPVLDVAARALGAIRREKTAQKRSMRARVERLTVVDDAVGLGLLRMALSDVVDAGAVEPGGVELVEGSPADIVVVLSPTDG